METPSSARAFPAAAAVSALLWLPLLAPDFGYPSLSQVLAVPTLRRTALAAAAVWLAVAGVLALAAALGARWAARRLSAGGAGPAAFCGVAAGSAALLVGVVALSRFAGLERSPVRAAIDLAAALLVASAVASLFATLAVVTARRRWVRAFPWLAAVLASAVWALLAGNLARATEAATLGLGTWPVAAGALAAGVATRLSGLPRVLAGAVAVVLALAGSLPALRFFPAQPAASAEAAGDQVRPPRGAPHVVMVVIDTWRWDATGLAREELRTTPRLADVAAGGATVFREAVAPAPSTLPSVKAMITGRFASHHGIPWWGNRPPPEDAWTLARALRAAGYVTGGFTSNALIRKAGFEAGFERFWAAGGLDKIRHSFFLYGLLARGDYWRLVPLANAIHVHKVDGDSVVDRFVDWLDRLPDRRRSPLFAYVHVVEPHFPYHDRGYGLVPEEVRDLPETYTHHQLMRLPKGDPQNARYRDAPAMREMLGRYHEEVRDADRLLGRVVDALAERGLYDDTVLVVVGDHGEEFLEHHGFGHGHDVYDELVRVPLVIRWPRRPPFDAFDASVEMPVSLLDVFPTLTDVLELPIGPRPFVGRSLLPELRGEPRPRGVASEMVFGDRAHLAWRRGRLKARIVFESRRLPSESEDVEVFDVVADPGETRPLPLEGEAADFLDEARRELDTLWSEARDATVRALSPEDAPAAEDDEEDPEIKRLKALGYL